MLNEVKRNCTMARHCRNTSNFSLANDSLAFSEEGEMPSMEIDIKLTFEVLIACFGVIGNFLVVIVISRLGKKKQPTDFYVQNLAIADLGILTFTFSLGVIKEKAPFNWPFGEFACCYLYPIPEIFYGASVWYITVIAIERYLKVVTVKNIRHKVNTSLQRARAVAVFVWAMSFLILCLPLYFVVEYKELSDGAKMCDPLWPQWTLGLYLGGVLTFFTYILPLAVISFTYLRISRKINRSSLFIKAMRQEQQQVNTGDECTLMANVKNARLMHNKRAKRILTPLVVVFAVTMLPLNILRVTIVFWPEIIAKEYYSNLIYAAFVSVIVNSSANPVIYSVVSRDFRKRINNLCCRCRWGNLVSVRIIRVISQSRSRPSSRSRSRSRSRKVELFVLSVRNYR